MKIVLFCFLISLFNFTASEKYDPTWASLDARPLPAWFDEAKIGIFIHWGVFSVPSFASEWFWWYWKGTKRDDVVQFMEKNYPPTTSYQDFAKDFTAEFFNADEWADLFQKSGAKYVVLTSKHHEGYTLWPSKYSYSWNAQDVGPHRDLVGELAQAVRNKNLTFGLYHSFYEWFNPIYLSDKSHGYLTQEFVDNKVLPEMYELVNAYKPSVFWSDGDGEMFDIYWKSTEFLAWLYNESPVKDDVVVNDRWGIGTACKHGGFYSCQDRYNPGTLQLHKWENAMTLDSRSWGYRRNANISDYLTTHDLIKTLVETVSCGGNILINIGPTKEGIITPIFQERLLNLGSWLSLNGEAIYSTSHWTVQNDTLTPGVWYTANDNLIVYAITLQWPDNNILDLQSATGLFVDSNVTVNLLGSAENLKWEINNDVVSIAFPDKAQNPSEWAWVVKIVQ